MLCNKICQEWPQCCWRRRIQFSDQTHASQFLRQVRFQVRHPSSQLAFDGVLVMERFKQLLYTILDTFGRPLRHLAKPDRRPPTVEGDELNSPVTVLVACNTGHCFT